MEQEAALQRKLSLWEIRDQMKKESALSEKEIIELVKEGNKDAYQTIVIRYMKTAYYIALGFVRNHQDALDVSQEAFIKAFRKIKNFDSHKPFFPWFYKLMKNLCLDHLKRHRRLKEIPLEHVQIIESEKEDRELKETLWKGIAMLSFDQRELIILRYFRQLSYQEIAELTGKPIGTVMSSLYYAKKRLKGIVEKYLGLE